MTWSLPKCDTNIKQIKVEYRKKGETSWLTKTAASWDTEVTVYRLQNEAEYEVRVVVVDINGQEHVANAIRTAKTGM